MRDFLASYDEHSSRHEDVRTSSAGNCTEGVGGVSHIDPSPPPGEEEAAGPPVVLFCWGCRRLCAFQCFDIAVFHTQEVRTAMIFRVLFLDILFQAVESNT